MNIFYFQKRCVNCGDTFKLEKHHRFFRSESEKELHYFLKSFGFVWGIYDIQNEVVLCKNCHDKIHFGDRKLRYFFRESYTDPKTGLNIPLIKTKSLW